MRVPKKHATIGTLFGIMETNKEEFGILEYSASQTTME